MNNDDRALLEREEREVAEALRFGGVKVGSVYDLVNSPGSYPAAVPILARLLGEVRHDRMKEGIARALSVKEARPVAHVLIDEFRSFSPSSKSGEHAKWAIGNAISIAAGDKEVQEVTALIRERHHGWTRSMLPLALSNTKNQRDIAIRELINALEDDDVAAQAAQALAKLKAVEAIEPLEGMRDHQLAHVRKAVISALTRINKAADKS